MKLHRSLDYPRIILENKIKMMKIKASDVNEVITLFITDYDLSLSLVYSPEMKTSYNS